MLCGSHLVPEKRVALVGLPANRIRFGFASSQSGIEISSGKSVVKKLLTP